MMKIDLSSEQEDDREDEGQETISTSVEDTAETSLSETPEEGEHNAKSKGRQRLSLALLGVFVVLTLVYFGKDRIPITGLFGDKQEVIQPAVAPPPPPAPEPVIVPVKPDPTFVILNGIGEVIPPRLWLTSAVVMYDGTYEIKGMAFSHETITTMISSLGHMGKITSQNIPKKLKSPETIYRFGISGALGDITIPEIMDVIPTDKLIIFSEAVKERRKEFGIRFTRSPESGKTYTENDLPFSVEGSYKELKQLIGELCPEGGDVKVNRLIISPSSPGNAFDNIKASFSLRTVSSI